MVPIVGGGYMTADQENEQSRWGLALIQGIAAVLLGLLLVSSPEATAFVLAQFFAFYLLITGAVEMVSIFTDVRMWGWKLVSGILGVCAGLVVLRHPVAATILIPTIMVIVVGLLAVGMGCIGVIKGLSNGGLGSAILSVLTALLGLSLLASPMLTAYWLPELLGILAIVGGISGITGAYAHQHSRQSELRP
jgi:uncharacterized membrane protein HdeD (DUF308 family)